MDNLALHPQTHEQVQRFITEPKHALLLVGATGIGKKTLAETLVSQIITSPFEKLATHPYHRLVAPDEKGTISIEAIRGVQKFLQLKTTGKSSFRRAVIVENAQSLTTEAQNAFLKLLEEPPSDTVVILTVSNIRALLPTILSRTQVISVYPPDEATLLAHFKKYGKDETTVMQAKFLSGGLPGLMHALLSEESHPLLESVQVAKDLLQKNTFERLALVDTLAKQKATTSGVLEALVRISMSAQTQAVAKQDTARLRQWHTIRKEVICAQIALSKNANPKLTLTKMLLHM